VAGHRRIDGKPMRRLAYDYTVLAGTQGAPATARRTGCST